MVMNTNRLSNYLEFVESNARWLTPQEKQRIIRRICVAALFKEISFHNWPVTGCFHYRYYKKVMRMVVCAVATSRSTEQLIARIQAIKKAVER